MASLVFRRRHAALVNNELTEERNQIANIQFLFDVLLKFHKTRFVFLCLSFSPSRLYLLAGVLIKTPGRAESPRLNIN